MSITHTPIQRRKYFDVGDGTSNGQLLIWDAASSKWVHTSHLLWNETNDYLGVGITTPAATLHIKGGGTGTNTSFLITNSADNNLVKVLDDGTVCMVCLPAKSTETCVVYVDSVGKLSTGTVSSGGITTANNGLNVVGTNVRLGGALTGDTTISGNTFLGFTSGTGFDGQVNAIAVQTDGKIVVGGMFYNYDGNYSPQIIRLNTDGSYDSTFVVGDGFDGTPVNTIAIQTDGKILVGGQFTWYNGTTSNYIIRLNTDGSYDSTFVTGTGFDGQVSTIAIQTDGKILVGGAFGDYNGNYSGRIVRLNTDGSIDSTFVVGFGFNSVVSTMAIQSDGKILVGGQFAWYNGTSSNYIARLNADSSIDSTFLIGSGFDGYVLTIAIQTDGKIVVGGNFSNYNGTTSNYIARLNTDGSYDNTFVTGTGFDGTPVNTIAIQPDWKIVVGGNFNNYNGTTSNYIARLNTDGSYDNTFVTGTGFDNFVKTMAIQSDGKIVVGGYFNSYVGITSNYIIRLSANGIVNNVNTYNLLKFKTATLEYDADYSLSYNARSLVDKGYVENNGVGWSDSVNLSTAVGCGTPPKTSTFTSNTFFGVYAGCLMTTGVYNVAIGDSALSSSSDSQYNVAIGSSALVGNQGGSYNVGIGYYALGTNSGGGCNIAIGYYALAGNLSGYNNTALGYQALWSNLSGYNNTALGYQAMCCNSTGRNNIAIGYQALTCNTTGGNNIVMGCQALSNNSGGFDNIAIGSQALLTNTTGSYNIAQGYQALRNNLTGHNNIALGYQALLFNTTGYFNTALGCQAMYCNCTGTDNIAIGYLALCCITSGTNNIALGSNALSKNCTGSNNIALGFAAMQQNRGGNDNVAMGNYALKTNTTGCNNIGLGAYSLVNNINGSNNIAMGCCALCANVSGLNNFAAGFEALHCNTSSCDNIAIGYQALFCNKKGAMAWEAAQNNIALGFQTLYFNSCGSDNIAMGCAAMSSNTTGCNNVALGYNALVYNTTGKYNVGIGSNPLAINISGCNNVAIGYAALYSNTVSNNIGLGYCALFTNTSGTNNNAQGYWALAKNTTGSNNNALGYMALSANTTGSNNIAEGYQALKFNTTGCNNIAQGQNALLTNSTGTNNIAQGCGALYTNTTGSGNTAHGDGALYSTTTGCDNVGIGRGALYSNTDGCGNVAYGLGAGYYETRGTNNIMIGYISGTQATVKCVTTESNQIVIGNNASTNAYIKIAWTVGSDARDKVNFNNIPHGLDFVNQLQPTSFYFKECRESEVPHGDLRYGFKAQDILALEGDNPVIVNNGDAEHLKLNESYLIPVLVNAIKELKAQNELLVCRIELLENK